MSGFWLKQKAKKDEKAREAEERLKLEKLLEVESEDDRDGAGWTTSMTFGIRLPGTLILTFQIETFAVLGVGVGFNFCIVCLYSVWLTDVRKAGIQRHTCFHSSIEAVVAIGYLTLTQHSDCACHFHEFIEQTVALQGVNCLLMSRAFQRK